MLQDGGVMKGVPVNPEEMYRDRDPDRDQVIRAVNNNRMNLPLVSRMLI